MFGLFKKQANNAKVEIKKVENRDLMQAIVGAMVLVAYADGEVIADVPVKQADALLQVGAARLADVEPTNDAPPADEAGGDAAADADKAPAKTGKAAANKKAR